MAGVGCDLCADASSWFSVVVPVDVVDLGQEQSGHFGKFSSIVLLNLRS